MESTQEKNKRIARNTLLLYCRTFITMCISLFTSRLILETLGVDNYGIYNVVGGFVAMFTIISGSLSSSISRYLTYGLGKGDLKELRLLFATSINVQAILAFVILILGETIGLWYVNDKMNLPPERLYAANWVLQCSIFTFILNLFSSPFGACIIAHEKMSIYAYMSILEVTLKLGFVYYLFITPFDKLITYAVSLAFISLIMQSIYIFYCHKHFLECRFKLGFEKKTLKEMTSFAWWNFFGNCAYIFNTQGVNMAVNSFFGVVFNAARGVVGQVENAIMSLINNFTTAFTPQITKSYAEGNKDYMFDLMCRGSKFSFLLFLLILVPVEICADSILHIWLKEVPDKSALFLRLSLFCSGTMLIGNPFLTGIMATGNIKVYQIVITLTGCLVFPLTILAYYLGAPVEISYIIYFLVYNGLIWVRMVFVKRLLQFPISRFAKQVMSPIGICLVLSFIPPFLLNLIRFSPFLQILIITSFSIISTSGIIYIFGLNRNEKKLIISKLRPLTLKLGVK